MFNKFKISDKPAVLEAEWMILSYQASTKLYKYDFIWLISFKAIEHYYSILGSKQYAASNFRAALYMGDLSNILFLYLPHNQDTGWVWLLKKEGRSTLHRSTSDLAFAWRVSLDLSKESALNLIFDEKLKSKMIYRIK